MSKRVLAGLLILLSFKANASVLLGTGFNSATGGRLVPALNLGIGIESYEASLSSTGVATAAYYHSSYKLSLFRTWKAGEFLFGTAEAGFGLGGLYAVRSFKDTGTPADTKYDYVLGPAFFVRWVFVEPVFLAVEGLYGLIGPSNRYGDLFSLNARDNVTFIIGIRL
jgi:hypothetical protein